MYIYILYIRILVDGIMAWISQRIYICIKSSSKSLGPRWYSIWMFEDSTQYVALSSSHSA